MTNQPGPPPARMGRPPATSHDELEQIGLELFTTRGFDETTIDEIASAAGISRRTFFRYYTSKNDLVWGDFDAELARLRERLAATPADVPMMAALREAVVAFNRVDADHVALHRRRMALIVGVPTLIAYSTLRFAGWRDVIAEFVAGRVGRPVEDLLPQLVAHAALGCALAAYTEWLARSDADLDSLLDEAIGELASGFAGHESPDAR
ncbi:mycofactocin system transcriptional regulator [Cryptosporangium phraense]|uniref:Mycofactocin system transcriptional regulator n=1 Tax=Cryptosporangium phraense TaxID=2593070 RepID=A0A545AMQ0_9ACTN|nr:mycofactocin system transcriptional regulator [Cryptosporangium phraense]TQS42624.1 mycofactocin system transcriptional regulator [Cryptosporangium phraense]